MILYTFNLLLLLATGVWTSLWFHHNSELFPLIGGLLGLGSFFAWIAVVTNILLDSRKKKFQELFDSAVLNNRYFCVFIVLINTALFSFIPASNGSLLLANISQTSLELNIDGEQAPVFVAPGETKKLIVPVPFRGEREIAVHAQGAPATQVKVSAFKRTEMLLPDATWRQPLILIRPLDETESKVFAGNTYFLKVSKCSDECDVLFEDVYRGQAIIVGTQDPVTLPDSVAQHWFSLGWDRALISRWSNPRLPTKVVGIESGDRLEVSVSQPFEETRMLLCKSMTEVLKSSGKPSLEPQTVEVTHQKC